MQDISLHLLDIIENSARASSGNIWISIQVDELENFLKVMVLDDGCGMDKETAERAQNPFYTSKEERIKKVGLGIPLFKQNAEACNGSFYLKSKPGLGTEITATFEYDNIDRMPLGNVVDTLLGSIIGHTETDFHIHLETKNKENFRLDFDFSTADVKKELGEDIPINYPDVVLFIEQLLNEGMKKINMEEC